MAGEQWTADELEEFFRLLPHPAIADCPDEDEWWARLPEQRFASVNVPWMAVELRSLFGEGSDA